MSDQPKPESDALLGDLESIRDLFDTKQQADEPVPVLDDVVEPTDDELPDLTIPDVAAGINSDLFDALLGDEWRDTAQKVWIAREMPSTTTRIAGSRRTPTISTWP